MHRGIQKTMNTYHCVLVCQLLPLWRGRVQSQCSMASPRPSRTRTQPERTGFVATDTPEYNSLVSLLPSTQQILMAASKAGAAAGGSALSQFETAYGELSEHESSSSDEESESQRPTQQLLQQADEALGDDEQAHLQPARSPKPRGAKGKGKAPAKKAALGKKLPNWTHEEDMQLLAAMQSWVKSTAGMLPGAIRTSKGAKVPKAWIDIGKLCDKVKGLDADAAAKAVSARWSTLRASCSVRDMMNTRAAECLFAPADQPCMLCVHHVRTKRRHSTMRTSLRWM